MKLFTNVCFIKNLENKFIFLLLVQFCTVVSSYAQKSHPKNQSPISAEIATNWANMTLYILKNTPKSTPTYNSRALGYMGLTMYESVVNSDKSRKSVASKIGINLIQPKTAQQYNWKIVFNTAQSNMLKSLFPHTNLLNISKIDSLEQYYFLAESKSTNVNIANVSVLYGKKISESIFEWSKADGGYEGFDRNFDSTYIVPTGKGFWTIPVKGQIVTNFPLHPTWGKNITFAKANYTLPIPEMLPFGYESNDLYFQNMKAVYDKGKSLTQEEKEIANWWGDDPGHSYSPPGHSYNLATIAINAKKSDLVTAAEVYARVGMGVSDAFVNCWKCKYHYHVERPASYIFLNITTLWELYWPEPPFPAFYSGHATQAAATASALTAVFGEQFEFTDDTNIFIPKDLYHNVEYKPRHYSSFWQAAEETALSRFYGGIHTQYDNKIGIQEGEKIGQNISELFNTK